MDDQLRFELLDMLRAGRKIDAIKRLREKTGAGLAEAKNEVEKLATENGIVTKSGCLGILVFFAIGILLAFSLGG